MKSFKRIGVLSLLAALGLSAYILSNPQFALTGTTQINNLMALGMPAQLASQVDAQYGTAVQAAIVPAAANTIDIGSASLPFRNIYGVNVSAAAGVLTPSVTYSASLGNISGRNSIIAAGAPTSAFLALPAATANVGKSYTVYNQGSNPVAIVPVGGSINVSAALTPFVCTTLKECKCTGLTTGVYGCSQQ